MVKEETLKEAPDFDKDDCPDKIDLRWLSEACRYYGCLPYWEA